MTKPEHSFSLAQFREWAKDHEGSTDQITIRDSFDTEIRAAEDAPRTLDFVISTSSVDRMGDTIAVDGWRLENYRKNGPVLWGHDASFPPIAKGTNVRIEGGKLKARAEFVPADNPAVGAFAEGIYQLYKGGFLKAVSVGFNPIKYEMSRDPDRNFGYDFKEQELLEFSCVNIPALPEALVQARAAGLKVDSIFEWAQGIIKSDSSMVVVPRLRFDAVNDLVSEFRLNAKRSKASKGASGIWRRAANCLNDAITGEEVAETETEIPAVETAGTDNTETPVEVSAETDKAADAEFREKVERRLAVMKLKSRLPTR